MKHFDLFDAVRIVGFPNGCIEIPAYHSNAPDGKIKVGDIGVVIGDWPNKKYRVESVSPTGEILWQDHFDPTQLEILPVTAANYNRPRINEHWACNLALGQELLDSTVRHEALTFARKVMAFARKNVEQLIGKLECSGYRFASRDQVWQPPENDVIASVAELAVQGIHVPVSLQAWLMEVGTVDLCGTHPEWPKSGYYAGFNANSPEWYTDPLVVAVSLRSLLNPDERDDEMEGNCIDIAPDVVHKANVSGGAPVSMNAAIPSFDTPLIGQSGSFTLLSYLRHAFDWGGFPGFDYIADAPDEMLKDLRTGLIRL